jgi:hypothetical protein
VIIFVAIVAGFMFRRDVRRTALTPLVRMFTLALLAVVGILIASRTADFLRVDEVSTTSVDAVLTRIESRELGGGSDFQSQLISSPADVPGATVTILFRPFPWEAMTIQALAAALEGVLLLGLTVAAWPRLRAIWKFRQGRPFVVMCLAYIAMFIYAFSSFDNFGLIARQRVLVYPFLLALLCLPTVAELRHRRIPVPRPPATREAQLR